MNNIQDEKGVMAINACLMFADRIVKSLGDIENLYEKQKLITLFNLVKDFEEVLHRANYIPDRLHEELEPIIQRLQKKIHQPMLWQKWNG